MDEQRKWFFETETTPGKDSVTIAEITRNNLEYSINLVDEAEAEFERINSKFERSSTVGEMLSNSILCCRGVVHERESQSA